MGNVRKKGMAGSPRRDDLLLGFLYAWRVGRISEAGAAIRRYCEYICLHGCPEFVSDVILHLEGMDKWSAEAWIRQTHTQYVQDDRAMLRYIFGLEKRKEKRNNARQG